MSSNWDEVRADRQAFINEIRSQDTRNGKTKVKLAKLQRQLAKAQADLAATGGKATAASTPTGLGAPRVPSLGQAVGLMKVAADEAERAGDVAKSRDIRREILLLTMQASERDFEARGGIGPFGPGSRALFKTTHTIGEDSQVGGF
jgi:hypothetical protein